jgi:glycosyltransferase involved in cell wall biosynthesis
MTQVAIGMPVCNGERFVADAIKSALGQTHSDLVLYISDNASGDATEEICRSFAAGDPRVVYERLTENVGAIPNFNRLFHLARAGGSPQYFKWMAHDDLCAPTFVERCLSMLEARPELVLANPQTVLIDDDGRRLDGFGGETDDPPLATSPVARDRFGDVLRREVWCFPIFGVIRTRALAETGLLRPFSSSDKVLLSELAMQGPFGRVEEPLFFRRTHAAQLSAMDARDKARWASTERASRVPLPVLALNGYLQTARHADLSAGERIQTYGDIARLFARGDKWKKLFLPGPHNYLGWHGRERRDPVGHLMLTPAETVVPSNGSDPPDDAR